MIACLRLPYFAAALTPHEGAFVLVDGAGRIAAISAQAAAGGVGARMTLSEAHAHCAGLRVYADEPTQRHQRQDALMETLAVITPDVEVENTPLPVKRRGRKPRQVYQPGVDDDSLTLYVAPGKLKLPQVFEFGSEIADIVREDVQQTPAIGLAGGRFTARVGGLVAKPGEMLHVRHEADFLAPFGIHLLPVDGETLRQLNLLGLHSLGQVAALPKAALMDRFGWVGEAIHRMANGKDKSPVRPYTPPVTARVCMDLEGGTRDVERLQRVIRHLTRQAMPELEGYAVRDVTLICDGVEQTLALRQPESTPERVARAAAGLVDGIRRQVETVEVVLTGIAPPAPRQLSLFEREPLHAKKLQQVIQTLTERHGDGVFYRVRLHHPDSRVPEKRFRWDEA